MEEIKKIVFPVDLSDVSPRIAPTAVSIARKFDAEIHLLVVVETLKSYTSFYIPHLSLGNLEIDLLNAAEIKLQEFEDEYCQDYPKVVRVVKLGRPAEEILKYIDSAGIDLAVMGTHGRKGLDRALFGSVAERVLRESKIPVLTMKPAGPGKLNRPSTASS